VIGTRVGYTGGEQTEPTYHDLGNHSESIQIDFDPETITYEKLLRLFRDSHDPTARAWSRQYMSAIFYHGEEQRRLALEWQSQEENRRGKTIRTEIRPAAVFYMAEDYHQKYMLRQYRSLFNEYRAIYPRMIDFVGSTAVARANGYIGGNGSRRQLEADIDRLGLSPAGRKRLLEIYHSRRR